MIAAPPSSIGPDPMLGIRQKGLLKLVAGVAVSIGLLAVIVASGLHTGGLVGHLLLTLAAWPLAFAFAGTLELLRGRSLAELSVSWDRLSVLKRRAIAVLAVALIFVVAALMLLWRMNR